MKLRKLTYLAVVLCGFLVCTASSASADQGYNGNWQEVRKQQEDLRKAQSYLNKEIRENDRKGIRKAQDWVRKEQLDLREAQLAARDRHPPRYRMHGTYQDLPRHRGRGYGKWKKDRPRYRDDYRYDDRRHGDYGYRGPRHDGYRYPRHDSYGYPIRSDRSPRPWWKW